MSHFVPYFQLGMKHILAFSGLDHVLFIVALCSIYVLKDWRRVLILIIAFTVGHSITLVVATFSAVPIRIEIIKFLIAVTVFVTAFVNLFKKQFVFEPKRFQKRYLLALAFGLVHGFEFSTYFNSISGSETGVGIQLLAVDVGIAVGQIIVVLVFLAISYILINLFNVPRKDLNLVVSAGIAAIAITLMMDTKFW